jgi:hypothetical protein
MRKYEQRVRNGIALLDQCYPGWRDSVILESLQMASCTRCVLGQLYGDYFKGAWHIARGNGSNNIREMAIHHGFSIPYISGDPRWELLRDEWVLQIQGEPVPVEEHRELELVS